MIITRTPFRISFFGGGSDYKSWSENEPGSVISTTIDKYAYLLVRYLPPFFKYKYRIRYRYNEKCSKIEQIKHPSVKACLEYMHEENGIELVHTSDLPARSGIGSSSSFTVSFLHALNALRGIHIKKEKLSKDAIFIEQEILKENVGSQDQVAASFGGFNKIDFFKKNITVTPIQIKKDILNNLQKNLMLFFTNFSRTSSEIAGTYSLDLFKKRKEEVKVMKEMVDYSIEILKSGNLDKFGLLLDKSLQIKKSFSKKVSNKDIDDLYTTAQISGALGGKLCGSGGGGFLLLYVPEEKQLCVKMAMRKKLYVPFKFENNGKYRKKTIRLIV
jgi:D-glycero-alpha-D-manno-heptose-7-phosphate kinase